MTILTGIGRDPARAGRRQFAGGRRAGPARRDKLGGRTAVGRAGPTGFDVAAEAQGRSRVVHHQELPELIVVRIMAGDALDFLQVIELELSVEGQGIAEVGVQRGEILVIDKGDGMVAGQVRSQIARAGGQGGDATLHFNGGGAAADHAQGDGAIVATEAQTRGAVGLADCGLEGRAGVDDVVGDGGQGMAPQRRFPGGFVGGVAEDADVGLSFGFDRAGAADGEIVFGVDDGVGGGGCGHEREQQHDNGAWTAAFDS